MAAKCGLFTARVEAPRATIGYRTIVSLKGCIDVAVCDMVEELAAALKMGACTSIILTTMVHFRLS